MGWIGLLVDVRDGERNVKNSSFFHPSSFEKFAIMFTVWEPMDESLQSMPESVRFEPDDANLIYHNSRSLRGKSRLR